eukprot:CAMPEP_0206601248 /NCGR_PEP_ID=MMETSP0325_2-20121206/46482_1 /ASSEMBLY_ACC=CAM_ASM_000347 /TAXON_ID=2866 /ORGANISM="Crypthecodinium cohnii, Strain Seligo" /LENGTH=34 /DNA_ID= /DNA_START= /DNA_END= /DNA_ORIENTATION=
MHKEAEEEDVDVDVDITVDFAVEEKTQKDTPLPL